MSIESLREQSLFQRRAGSVKRRLIMFWYFIATISQEGLLWFQNLAIADPYGIIPLGFLIPSLIGISVSQSNCEFLLLLFVSCILVQFNRKTRFSQSSTVIRWSNSTWNHSRRGHWLHLDCIQITCRMFFSVIIVLHLSLVLQTLGNRSFLDIK